MKKFAIVFAAVTAALFFVSCNKEEAPARNEKQKIQFNFTVGDLVPETKATKTGWVNGDKINIWFDGNYETSPDLVLTYNGSIWEAGDLREGCELTEGDGTLVALYESQNDLATYKPEKQSQYLTRLLLSYDKSRKVDGSTEVISPASMMAGCTTTYSLSSDGILTSALDNWGFS